MTCFFPSQYSSRNATVSPVALPRAKVVSSQSRKRVPSPYSIWIGTAVTPLRVRQRSLRLTRVENSCSRRRRNASRIMPKSCALWPRSRIADLRHGPYEKLLESRLEPKIIQVLEPGEPEQVVVDRERDGIRSRGSDHDRHWYRRWQSHRMASSDSSASCTASRHSAAQSSRPSETPLCSAQTRR